MAYVIGQQIVDGFAASAAGQTWTRVASFIDDDSTVFAPAFVDQTGGLYSVTYTPIVTGHHVWLGTGTNGDPLALSWDVVTAAQADPAAALAAQTVTISSPLTASGTLTIVSGDDYLNADGRAISWDASGYPSLVGGTVTFTAIRAGTVRLTKAMTIVDLNTVRLELLSAETGTLFAGRAYTYEVNAMVGASDLLIASGSLVVT